MNETFTASAEIFINATTSQVWKALVDPELVKQWLFGTEMSIDLKVGGEITYKGVWGGKPYEDKGVILKLEPEKLLSTSYWSGFSGLPDLPENYQIVSYIITKEEAGTKLIIKQEGNKSEESAKHSEQNWGKVLASMKQLLEK